MDLARYLVDAVVLEGRSYREVALAHGVSKSYGGGETSSRWELSGNRPRSTAERSRRAGRPAGEPAVRGLVMSDHYTP